MTEVKPHCTIEGDEVVQPNVHHQYPDAHTLEDALRILQEFRGLVAQGKLKAVKSFRWEPPRLFIESQLMEPLRFNTVIFELDPDLAENL